MPATGCTAQSADRSLRHSKGRLPDVHAHETELRLDNGLLQLCDPLLLRMRFGNDMQFATHTSEFVPVEVDPLVK